MKPKQCAILIMAAGLFLLPLPGFSSPGDGSRAAVLSAVGEELTRRGSRLAAGGDCAAIDALAAPIIPAARTLAAPAALPATADSLIPAATLSEMDMVNPADADGDETTPADSTLPAPWPATELKLPNRYLPLAAPDLIDIWHIDGNEALEGALPGGQTGLLGQAAEALEDGQAFSRGFIARAGLREIQLIDTESGQNRGLPLPKPAGPGRDIEPLVYMPWHLGISPDGTKMLLITAEGYLDQEIDYFRLWVLDLEGHVENCLESPGLLSAGWFSDETICYIQFSAEDPSLSTGSLGFWNWQKANAAGLAG